MYGIHYLLIGCMIVVLQNRRISLKGGLNEEYGQVTIRIA